MSKLDAKSPDFKSLEQPDSGAKESGYETWFRAKVEEALQEAKEVAQPRLSIDQVRKKFGLDD